MNVHVTARRLVARILWNRVQIMRCVLCEQGVTPNGHSCSQIVSQKETFRHFNLIPVPMKVNSRAVCSGTYNVNKQLHWQWFLRSRFSDDWVKGQKLTTVQEVVIMEQKLWSVTEREEATVTGANWDACWWLCPGEKEKGSYRHFWMVYTVDGQPVQVVVIGLLSQLLHA